MLRQCPHLTSAGTAAGLGWARCTARAGASPVASAASARQCPGSAPPATTAPMARRRGHARPARSVSGVSSDPVGRAGWAGGRLDLAGAGPEPQLQLAADEGMPPVSVLCRQRDGPVFPALQRAVLAGPLLRARVEQRHQPEVPRGAVRRQCRYESPSPTALCIPILPCTMLEPVGLEGLAVGPMPSHPRFPAHCPCQACRPVSGCY